MSRKVYVTVHGHFTVSGKKADMEEVLDGLDCTFTSSTDKADIECLDVEAYRPAEGARHVHVDAKLLVRAGSRVDIEEVLSEMDYDFDTGVKGAKAAGSEILDWEITDSK